MKRMGKVFLLAISLFICATFFAACDIVTEPLEIPENFAYDGESLMWNTVENAEGYEIKIGDGEPIVVEALNYPFDAQGQEFTASIKALAKNEKYNSEEYTITFKPLGDVKNIRIDEDGYLVWDLVENATAYIVSVNNVQYVVDVNEFVQFAEGTNAIRVRAIVKDNNSYYSKWSQVSTYNMLESPKNLAYDDQKDKITWDTVRNAGGYILNINGEEIACTANSYTYVPQPGPFAISVRAVAPQNATNTYSSPYSEKIEYTLLPAIESLEEKDGGVTWSVVPDAKYQVEVSEGDRVVSYEVVQEASYHKFDAGTEYKVRVRIYPQNDSEFSVWSEYFEVYFLTSPIVNVIGTNGANNISFEISSQAGESAKVQDYTALIIKPNGEQIVHDNVTIGTFDEYDFNEGAGEYTFQVKANPKTLQGYYEFSSKYSQAIKIVRVADIDRVTMTENEEISFAAVNGAGGYRYVIGEEEVNIGTNTTFALQLNNSDGAEMSVQLSLYALGRNGKHTDGKYYLGSTTPKTVTVTKLATVGKPVPQDNRVSWVGVSNASCYQLQIGGKSYTTEGNVYNLSLDAPGKHEVKVRAIGDASAFIMSGEYSPILDVYKLSAPVVQSVTETGTIKWAYTPIAGENVFATGFEIIVGSRSVGSLIELNLREYDLSDNIEFNPQSVRIIAKGNNAGILDSEQSAQQVSVAKLHTVENLSLVNASGSIVWDTVQNANQYRFKYVCQSNGVDTYQDNQKTAFESLSNWKPGEYNVEVVARGYYNNNTNTYYVQSEAVNATFRKLESPTIDRQGDAYVWTGVDYAQNGYSVLMPNADPVQAKQNGTVWEFQPDFDRSDLSTAGIEVKFVTNGNDASGLIDSDAKLITQKVIALTKPSISVKYDSESKKFTLSTSKSAYPEVKYAFVTNGVEHVVDTNEYQCDGVSGTYTFAVKTLAGFFVGDNYYVDSDVSNNVLREIYKEIDESTIVHSKVSGGYTLSWTNPNGNVQCTVTVDGATVTDLSSNSCKLVDIESGSTVTVTISVKGNGSSTYDSESVTYIFTAV